MVNFINEVEAELSETKPHTSIASDDNAYPSEWWINEQRFDQHEPPENVAVFVMGAEYKRVGTSLISTKFPDGWQLRVAELRSQGRSWTLAPNPPKEKQKPNSWDEYMFGNDIFDFKGSDKSAAIYIGEVASLGKQIDALYDWKNHIISKSEGV